MLLKKQEINGFCDELEALEQVIYKILSTERYKYNIYSWNYGIELDNLFGKPVNYVVLELEKRIKDALMIDNRIKDITNFAYDVKRRNVVIVNFDVITIFGDISIKKEVNY